MEFCACAEFVPAGRQHTLFSSGDDKYAAGAVTSGFVSIHSEMAESAAVYDAGRMEIKTDFSAACFFVSPSAVCLSYFHVIIPHVQITSSGVQSTLSALESI